MLVGVKLQDTLVPIILYNLLKFFKSRLKLFPCLVLIKVIIQLSTHLDDIIICTPWIGEYCDPYILRIFYSIQSWICSFCSIIIKISYFPQYENKTASSPVTLPWIFIFITIATCLVIILASVYAIWWYCSKKHLDLQRDYYSHGNVMFRSRNSECLSSGPTDLLLQSEHGRDSMVDDGKDLPDVSEEDEDEDGRVNFYYSVFSRFMKIYNCLFSVNWGLIHNLFDKI